MIIYKITNKENGKMYIGQTINSIEDRWHRHCNDAMNNILDTHFARAIRKYGKENFTIEEIDTASSQDELNKKGYKVEKSAIKLNNTISSLGFHNVNINLYPEITAIVKVHVIK